MGFSLDWDDARDDWGGPFSGSTSLRERVHRRINQYNKLYGTDSKKFEHVVSRLNYFSARLEEKIAKRIRKGKEDTKRTKKLQDLLAEIQDTLKPLGDTTAVGGISRGAARENAEGRAATIYLGGYSSTLGIQVPTTPTSPGAGERGGVGRTNPGRGRTFLGAYYGGGEFRGGARDRGRFA